MAIGTASSRGVVPTMHDHAVTTRRLSTVPHSAARPPWLCVSFLVSVLVFSVSTFDTTSSRADTA